jgi:hypothetical protein
MRVPSIPRQPHPGAGLTIPAFAKLFGLPVGQVRRAVKRKEIATVKFAGLERITPAEAHRVAELFGLKPCGTDEAED